MILLRAVLREHNLDRILEGQIEGLRRKIPDAIREGDSPEGRGALLAVNARETIPDAGVARHRSVPDLRIGILGLKHKLDALNGRGECLETAPKTPHEEEIDSYSENYDRSHTDLDQEILGRRALPEGRAPYEVTEHGSFRDRLNTGRCGGGRCPLNLLEEAECEVHTKTPVRTQVSIP